MRLNKQGLVLVYHNSASDHHPWGTARGGDQELQSTPAMSLLLSVDGCGHRITRFVNTMHTFCS
jgi:hypothetical protein